MAATGYSSHLLEAYKLAKGRQPATGYDEMLDADGQVRPEWRALLAGLESLAPSDRNARSQQLDRRVRETGIAHDIFSDPNRVQQGWRLDLAPLVVSNAQWRWLSMALTQRARLFDAILVDLYGPQRLMRDGHIPPELVFSDSSFLRPCQGILPHGGHRQFYAADLARDADGRWRVIDSHTETLAGLGIALANRVVHTQVAGDLFKQANALRLAPHFQDLQNALTAKCGRDSGRIALLTPGAHHPDYFSHAYLARYLGYLLVEGSDLRTKGAQVYLKTLEGLKEIDLIVRCVDGQSCDPLELDPGGFEGPAGLLRSCRKTPGLVVNSVGTALAQNRGLGPYLPQLSRHLLGEDLALPDAPRWWLGDAEAQSHVLANLDEFVVRRAQEGTGRPGQAALGEAPRPRSASEYDAMRRKIGLQGAQLVAEEKIGFSVAPVSTPDGLTPRPFAVRFYVSMTTSGYQVMPGGLAMTVDPERAVALSAPEGHARDVWVISDAELPPHVSLWRPTVETARVQRSQRALQSRVADDLFWLGRYTERADWTMRVLRGALRRLEQDGGPADGRWAARTCLDVLLTDRASAGVFTRAQPTGEDIEQLCAQLIASDGSYRTLERTFEGLYRVAHLTRDRLSLEAWQSLSRFRPSDTWTTALAQGAPLDVLAHLDEGLASVAAFNGLMHENMTRNFGWSFLDMGRRLERAYNLSESIAALFVPGGDPQVEANSALFLLELADSYITYRSRYRLDPMLPLVLDLLLLDDANPRSLAHQLAAISSHLAKLPDADKGTMMGEERRLILALQTSIRLADVEAISRESKRVALDQLMRDQLQLLPDLSNAVAAHYFNLSADAPQRVHLRNDPPSPQYIRDPQ